jgi:hypothetical protein
MNRHFPFSSLGEKIQYMRNHDAEITNMLSVAGNKRASKMVNEAVKQLLDRQPRDLVVSNLRISWKEIEKRHPEINQTDVRESIFWYLDGACSYVRYQEIGMDEIKKK